MQTDTTNQTGHAPVNGTRLYYEVAGSGSAVLLIHGNFADRRHWDDQFPVFARNHKVIRYDVRGFGRSALPVERQPYSHHSDAAALLRYLGVAGAHIIGLSMGAGIAADFVLSHPQMSRSLVSVGPWVVGHDSSKVKQLFEGFKAIGSAFQRGGATAAIEEFVTGLLGGCVRDQTVAERLRCLGADYSFWHLCHADPGETQVSADTGNAAGLAAQRISEIQVPTLVITAEHDVPACVEIAALLERTVSGARKVVMPGCGHIINMEVPREFNCIVLDFLARTDQTRGDLIRNAKTQ